MTNANIEYLQANGPTPTGDLPHNIEVEDRMAGAAIFRIKGANSNHTPGTNGRLQHIAYLLDDHDKVDVVSAWIDANERYVSDAPRKAVRIRLRRQGRQWHDAIDAAFPTQEADE